MPDPVLDSVSELVNRGLITPEQGQQLYLQSYQQQAAPGTPPTGTSPGLPQVAPPAPTPGGMPQGIPQGYSPLPPNTLPVWKKRFPGQWVQDAKGNIAFVPAEGKFAGQIISSGAPPMHAPSNIPEFFNQHIMASKLHEPSGTAAQAPPNAATTTTIAQPDDESAPDKGASLIVKLADAAQPGKIEGKRVVHSDSMAAPLRDVFGDVSWDLDKLSDDEAAMLLRLTEIGE